MSNKEFELTIGGSFGDINKTNALLGTLKNIKLFKTLSVSILLGLHNWMMKKRYDPRDFLVEES